MRIFQIQSTGASEGDDLSSLLALGLPANGFVWISCTSKQFETQLPAIQQGLQQLCGQPLLDLHVSDLLNQQLPSHYDYTSQYDLLVFRRLATRQGEGDGAHHGEPLVRSPARGGPPVLRRIDTSPVGFALFDQLLLTVHPSDCSVREAYAARLLI